MAIVDKYVSTTGAGLHDGASENNAFSFSEMMTDLGNARSGVRYNLKADGTYSLSSLTTITGGGSVYGPAIIRGYNLVTGDGLQGRTDSNGPLITTNMPLLELGSTFRVQLNAPFTIFESVFITGNSNSALLAIGSNDVAIKSCKVINANVGTSAAAVSLSNTSRAILFDTDIEMSESLGGSAALIAQGTATQWIHGCRIKASGTIGAALRGSAVMTFSTILQSQTGVFIDNNAASSLIAYNTLVGNAYDGVAVISGITTRPTVVGNMITDNGHFGIKLLDGTGSVLTAFNRYRSNASGNFNGSINWIDGTDYKSVNEAGAPSSDYVNFSANNFNLSSTSLAVESGLPLPLSIGAFQVEASAPSAVVSTAIPIQRHLPDLRLN